MKMMETLQTQQQDDSDVRPSPEIDLVAHVRVLTGATPHAVHLVPSQGASIGRVGGDCSVVIDDARMSRKHVRIEHGVTGWHLQDLGSRNGFHVDGPHCGPGARVALADGAVIRLGDTLMVFRTRAPVSYGAVDSPVFPGVSPDAASVRQRIDVLAGGVGHVLIIGETGTGKEYVAKAIAQQRAPQPFVPLNCAQLNRDLAHSELFGHVRGSFTNATASKPGLVDKAGEGVLFLDEIGDLSIGVQPELLRFLEDGSYRALGSTELRKSAARVVAATNVDLDAAVVNSRFRRDLLARLRSNHLPLELPPLRERREDILQWTQLFFSRSNCDPGPTPWTVSALECLLLYPWNENLRGLEGIVAHVAESAPSFPCGVEYLPLHLREYRAALRASSGLAEPPQMRPKQAPPAPPPTPPHGSISPRVTVTKAMIEDALEQTQGRMRRAAQRLAIDRTRLYRLCRQHSVDFKLYRAPGAQPDDDEDDDREDTGAHRANGRHDENPDE
jgi:DNA-binding NtrC family response regulator